MYKEHADSLQRVAVLAGGFRGWEASGLPVTSLATTVHEAMKADAFALKQGVEFVQHQTSVLDKEKPQREKAAQDVNEYENLQQDLQETTVCLPMLEPANLPVTDSVDVLSLGAMESVQPDAAHQLLKGGDCVLVDVRDEDRAAGLIQGSMHVPAVDVVPFPDKVPDLVRRLAEYACVLFTCQYSRHRAPQCAKWYRDHADPAQRVGVLSGGFRGWEAQGLPIVREAKTHAEAQAADSIAIQHGEQFVKQASDLA
jgi:rhodanese-related sulfurtransferase